MIIYSVQQNIPAPHIAVGATLGQHHAKHLLNVMPSIPAFDTPGEIVIFDLHGVEAVNASYIQATALWLAQSAQLANDADGEASLYINERCHSIPLNIYPFVAGLAEEVAIDVNFVFTQYALPCLEALTWNSESVLSARLLGKLDGALRTTLQLATKEPIVTASSLHEGCPEEKINITGWNNRLADLYRLRLLRRTRQGKQWLYSSIIKECLIG